MATRNITFNPVTLAGGSLALADWRLDAQPRTTASGPVAWAAGQSIGTLDENGEHQMDLEVSPEGSWYVFSLPLMNYAWEFVLEEGDGLPTTLGEMVSQFRLPSPVGPVPGPPGTPGEDRVSGYTYHEFRPLTLDPITSKTPDMDAWEVELLNEVIPGGLTPNNDFVAQYEGYLYFDASENDNYDFTLTIGHTFENGEQIVSSRTILFRVQRAAVFTLPIAGFSSRSRLQLGSYTDKDGNRITVTNEMLNQPTTITMVLKVERHTPNTQFAIDEASLVQGKATWYQLGSVKGSNVPTGTGPPGGYFITQYLAAATQPSPAEGGSFNPRDATQNQPASGWALNIPIYDASSLDLWGQRAFYQPDPEGDDYTPDWSNVFEAGGHGTPGPAGGRGPAGPPPTKANVYPINKDILVAGDNVTLTPSDGDETITISATPGSSAPTKAEVFALNDEIFVFAAPLTHTNDTDNDRIIVGVKAKGIDTAHLADGAVTEPKLDDQAVSGRTIAGGAVTRLKLDAPQQLPTALGDNDQVLATTTTLGVKHTTWVDAETGDAYEAIKTAFDDNSSPVTATPDDKTEKIALDIHAGSINHDMLGSEVVEGENIKGATIGNTQLNPGVRLVQGNLNPFVKGYLDALSGRSAGKYVVANAANDGYEFMEAVAIPDWGGLSAGYVIPEGALQAYNGDVYYCHTATTKGQSGPDADPDHFIILDNHSGTYDTAKWYGQGETVTLSNGKIAYAKVDIVPSDADPGTATDTKWLVFADERDGTVNQKTVYPTLKEILADAIPGRDGSGLDWDFRDATETVIPSVTFPDPPRYRQIDSVDVRTTQAAYGWWIAGTGAAMSLSGGDGDPYHPWKVYASDADYTPFGYDPTKPGVLLDGDTGQLNHNGVRFRNSNWGSNTRRINFIVQVNLDNGRKYSTSDGVTVTMDGRGRATNDGTEKQIASQTIHCDGSDHQGPMYFTFSVTYTANPRAGETDAVWFGIAQAGTGRQMRVNGGRLHQQSPFLGARPQQTTAIEGSSRVTVPASIVPDGVDLGSTPTIYFHQITGTNVAGSNEPTETDHGDWEPYNISGVTVGMEAPQDLSTLELTLAHLGQVTQPGNRNYLCRLPSATGRPEVLASVPHQNGWKIKWIGNGIVKGDRFYLLSGARDATAGSWVWNADLVGTERQYAVIPGHISERRFPFSGSSVTSVTLPNLASRMPNVQGIRLHAGGRFDTWTIAGMVSGERLVLDPYFGDDLHPYMVVTKSGDDVVLSFRGADRNNGTDQAMHIAVTIVDIDYSNDQ